MHTVTDAKRGEIGTAAWREQLHTGSKATAHARSAFTPGIGIGTVP
jgi:hypothetical protein